jgi:glycosyltransferase involved in cell wall biosynthesis
VESYLSSSASTECASLFSITGNGPHDLFRDLIVLKRWTPAEKGVILLKYARTFSAVVALFDLHRLMQRYTFVLEPCWVGYWDPKILMFLTSDQPVIVQCFTDDDYQLISSIGAPFAPIRLGPADWVNADLFKPPKDDAKTHDLVMVANWGLHKRHEQLFKALRSITDCSIRVLLIGFPWRGRTADDIRREAAALGNPLVHVDVIENVPPMEVADYVGRCRAHVFLSPKEGDNKALVEAMFANVPAIVYEKTIGGARSRINGETGILAADDQLGQRIRYMLEHHAEFSPRAWVLKNSGSTNATRLLNDALQRAVVASGGGYVHGIVEKTNSPNLSYKDANVRHWFQVDYEFILSCGREGVVKARDAA